MEHQPWYLPRDLREAADAIEDVKSIVRFVNDCITQEGPPKQTFSMSVEGQTGLYFVLCLVEDVLDRSNRLFRKAA